MPVFIIVLVVFLIIVSVILAAGVGFGFLLNWVCPAIDLGAGTIAGVTAFIGAAVLFFLIAVSAKPGIEEDELDDEDVDEELRGRQIEYIMAPARRYARKRHKKRK